jgi:hypothetical protein
MKKTCQLKEADLKIDGKSTRDRLNALEQADSITKFLQFLTAIAIGFLLAKS